MTAGNTPCRRYYCTIPCASAEGSVSDKRMYSHSTIIRVQKHPDLALNLCKAI